MNLFDGSLHRLGLRKWQKAAHDAPVTGIASLRRTRDRARPLLAALGALPRAADAGRVQPVLTVPALPHGTDWSWRPEIWQTALPAPGMASVRSHAMLGGEVTVFHDCPRSELALHQARNASDAERAPYGLHLEVFAFGGSFLSLALDLPQSAMDGLSRRHLVRLDTILDLEKPLRVFARLNVRHGPNTEQIVRELPPGDTETAVEFDLAYTRLNEKRLERAWIDLIFETPHRSRAALRDVTLSRRLRADL